MSYNDKTKLTRHKKLMIVQFMDCTKKIIREEGIEAVTIRKVAKCSSMNSATIYNYFVNLEHLLVFSLMDELSDYIKALPEAIEGKNNSLEIFYAVWDCFIKYSYTNTKPYMKLFFSNLDNQIEYYIEQYYRIFPLELDEDKYTPHIIDMLNSSEIFTRNIYILNDCVKDGYIKESDAYDINNILVFTYEGILRRIDSGKLDSNKGIDMFNCYIRKIMNSFME
ncbi:MAG: TetR/AcrR family transcriptional regulator [Tissierellia bacterium]|nr:TetR/AcrR family transcriptional regulator [Tissierellia bacterium]